MRAAIAGLTFVLVFLVGCATQPVDTPNKRLAHAEITFTAVVATAINAVETGLIPADSTSARVIVQSANGGAMALDAAHQALASGNMDEFTARIAIVQATIAGMRSILTAVGAKTP